MTAARPIPAVFAAILSLLALPAQAQHRVADYLDRIARYDDAGPMLDAVIVVAPDAAAQVAKAAGRGGPLAGKPVLVKDNIETREWPTTAGSLALADNRTGRDAPIIAGLRKAGAVILGKTNLSEWANIRSSMSSSGWSAVGGQTRNPHAIDRSACGSSSGSGAAVAAGFAWAAIGTETDGSITCPASVNGVVGFKPTVGLLSRTWIVPISHSQDTPGPLAANVHDAALLLTAMAGPDPADPATAGAAHHATDFAAGLADASLKGVRIGVMRKQIGRLSGIHALFEQALADLHRAGAELVDIDYSFPDGLDADELTVLEYELRTDLGSYLQALPGSPPVRSLADVIAFNKAHQAREMRWFGQDLFEAAEASRDADAYAKARGSSLKMASEQGIDRLLAEHQVSLLVAPTTGPAWPIDLVTGDHYIGGIGITNLPAIAGYPHLSVPMGAIEGLPVGLSLVGPKWSDRAVLEAGAAYERARTAALPEPTMDRWRAGAAGKAR